MKSTSWMIYGAYGYTGTLIAEEAVERGHRPVLAGRSPEKLAPLARRLDLEWTTLDLNDADALTNAISDVDLVYHAAGPFVHTSEPMIRACLAGGTHYLDITGEIAVLENTFSHDRAAREQGVVLISGVGFDVVPSDCLAKYVADQIPDAAELELAIAAIGNPSAGTAKTVLESLPEGGTVRRDGQLRSQPIGEEVREVRFPHGRRTVVAIPWGDLATAYRTTGVPNITTYFAYPPGAIRFARMATPLAERLLAMDPIRCLAQSLVDKIVQGPDAETRRTARSYIWARAGDRQGNEAEAWLETMEAYQFTAVAGVRCVEKVLEQQPTGALTPALAFGADFVLEIDGTERYDSL